jgi:hypothetical protein
MGAFTVEPFLFLFWTFILFQLGMSSILSLEKVWPSLSLSLTTAGLGFRGRGRDYRVFIGTCGRLPQASDRRFNLFPRGAVRLDSLEFAV